MTSRLRKLMLASHVTFSVGWLGAVAAYLALAVIGMTTSDNDMARAAYRSMEAHNDGALRVQAVGQDRERQGSLREVSAE